MTTHPVIVSQKGDGSVSYCPVAPLGSDQYALIPGEYWRTLGYIESGLVVNEVGLHLRRWIGVVEIDDVQVSGATKIKCIDAMLRHLSLYRVDDRQTIESLF